MTRTDSCGVRILEIGVSAAHLLVSNPDSSIVVCSEHCHHYHKKDVAAAYECAEILAFALEKPIRVEVISFGDIEYANTFYPPGWKWWHRFWKKEKEDEYEST